MPHRHTGGVRRSLIAAAAVLVTTGLLGACSAEDDPASGDPAPSPTSATSGSEAGSTDPTTGSTAAPEQSGEPESPPSEPPPDPVSVPALAEADLPGRGLRLGAVREQTGAFTSYDVTFAGTRNGTGTPRMRLSGVLNVPTGRGPFPAVVLAHGYIDPAVYERGQGMTRERGYLAEAGYVALHVDYRNHAESTDDPRTEAAVRLGYSADAIAAARALTSSGDVRVDPDRVALFGRSMGGGVMFKALEAEPGLFAAGVGWASVSSLEAENFAQFQAPDGPIAEVRREFAGTHGLPRQDPEFWRGISARPFFDDITEPILLVHGRNDSTCPPRWASESQRALTRAGVDSTLEWYDDEHAFGPAFFPAMQRTVAFLDNRMPA